MPTEYLLDDGDTVAVEAGDAARFLVTHPAYLAAIEKLRTDCSEAILTSSPHEAKEREAAYNLSRALTALTAELLDCASIGETIALEAAANSEPRPNDPVAQDNPGHGGDF